MNEEELKALVGDKAFEAMSPEQRAAAIAKYTPPKPDPKDDPKDKGKGKGGKSDDEDDDEEESLRDKVRKDKEAKEAKENETKALESAIAFNYGVEKMVSDNVDVLPADFDKLLKTANGKRYDSQSEKASAIKAAFIEEFFNVQANVELLTNSQKGQLDDFMKLTENGKKQKANAIYENIFEPALETLKKVKKAEELGKARSGFASSSKVEDKYKERLMAHSRKALLNEKGEK